MKYNRSLVITEIVSLLFVLLFIYAAFSKINDFEKFQVELGKSPILNHFVKITAIGIPMLEIGIALLLMWKRLQYIALYASFSLMVAFSTYIFIILNFSSYIPCSCGGLLETLTWSQHLIFNFTFIVLAVLAILIHQKPAKINTN